MQDLKFENNELRQEVDNVFIKNDIIQKNLEQTINELDKQLENKN